MIINILAIVLIEVPCAYFFSQWWGLQGIWYAYALAFVSLCIGQGVLSICLERKNHSGFGLNGLLYL